MRILTVLLDGGLEFLVLLQLFLVSDDLLGSSHGAYSNVSLVFPLQNCGKRAIFAAKFE